MKDKELLYAAIDDYELINRSSKAILKILISLEGNKEAVIALSILKLSKMAKISRNAAYEAIKALENKSFIRKWTENRRFSFFLLQHEKLNYLIQNYCYLEQKKKYLT